MLSNITGKINIPLLVASEIIAASSLSTAREGLRHVDKGT